MDLQTNAFDFQTEKMHGHKLTSQGNKRRLHELKLKVMTFLK